MVLTSLHRIHYNILFLLQQRPDLRSAVQMPVFTIQCHIIALLVEKIYLAVAPAILIRLKIPVQIVFTQIIQTIAQIFIPVHQHVPVGIRQRSKLLLDFPVDFTQMGRTILVYFIGNETGVANAGNQCDQHADQDKMPVVFAKHGSKLPLRFVL